MSAHEEVEQLLMGLMWRPLSPLSPNPRIRILSLHSTGTQLSMKHDEGKHGEGTPAGLSSLTHQQHGIQEMEEREPQKLYQETSKSLLWHASMKSIAINHDNSDNVAN